jgi:hypothetical protein
MSTFHDVVALPTDALSEALLATVFAEESEALANHSVRSFLFARTAGLHGPEFELEFVPNHLLFAACLLHDLGLTRRGADTEGTRFEVSGADYAADILHRHHVDRFEIRQVWEAITLHTSPHLAERWHPLARLTRTGIGIDFGRSVEAVPEAAYDEITAAFPRLDIETHLADAVIGQADTDPDKAPLNSWADLLRFERHHTATTRFESAAVRSASGTGR